jgi:16S rRNA C967 or C1407 C5-methylase (RsmB/RsmF family)
LTQRPAQIRPVEHALRSLRSDRVEATVLRVNTRRTSSEALASRLESQGFRLQPIPGLPSFLSVLAQPYPVGRTVEHWLGMFYLQQAATGAAALALGVRGGERVLDLCAAPGGKASHLAELQGESGVVVAGDSSPGRIRALVGNLYRLGHAGVIALAADGRTFPAGARFDRVLVDAPCSGEGNPRQRRGAYSSSEKTDSFRSHIAGMQRALLRRAVELTRPGGTILYATCTSAAEENEAVVARALARLPVRMTSIELDLPHEGGLTSVPGKAGNPDLEQAWRIEQGHLGSGVLFMARLERQSGDIEGDPDGGWSSVPSPFSGPVNEREPPAHALAEGLIELEQTMGVRAETFRNARWLIRGDSVWLHSCAEWPLDGWWAQGADSGREWDLLSVGVRAFRLESSGRMRATNDLLRRLDGALTQRTSELSPSEMVRLIEEGELAAAGTSDGYVALRLEQGVVGRGFVRGGRLRSEIPRPQASVLADALRVASRT